MSSWSRGRDEIHDMLERRELTRITANEELAQRLLATARQHLLSARQLAASDPYLGYAAVHDAIRKALSSLLQMQGLPWARSFVRLTVYARHVMRPSIQVRPHT
jgi:hypothetical protein